MKKSAKVLSVVLCVLLAVSAFALSAEAKKKAKKYVTSISITKKASITIPANKSTVKKSFKVTVKVKGKASKAFTAKSSKASVAAVKASSSAVTVTAKKAGTAKITVTTKAKNNKNKKLSKVLTVTVKKASAPSSPAAPVNPTPSNPDNPKEPDTPSTPETPKEPDTPTNPDTPSTPTVRNITLNTTLNEISRKGSSGKNEQGQETVVDIPLWQATSVFNYAPANADELKQVHRADALLPNEVDAAITAQDGAKGRFEVVALYFAALKAFDPKNPDTTYAMMEELCESPTTKILSLDSFNNFSRNSMKDNLSKAYKYKYVGNAYFDGAEPSNGYTPTEPLTVTLEDYVYASQPSNQYQTQVYKVVTRFKGADSERIIQVYQDSIDGKWYIFSDSWMGFTSDIKEPALKYQAQWQNENWPPTAE